MLLFLFSIRPNNNGGRIEFIFEIEFEFKDIEIAWWIGTWQNAPGRQDEEEEEMLDIVL